MALGPASRRRRQDHPRTGDREGSSHVGRMAGAGTDRRTRGVDAVARAACGIVRAPHDRAGLRMERRQAVARARPRRHRGAERPAVHGRDHHARPLLRVLRHPGGREGAALGDDGLRLLLPARLPAHRPRPVHPAVLAHRARLRRGLRRRARHRLHLAGLDPDEVVPGSPGARDRHRDHGLRRRRAHRGSVHPEPADGVRRQLRRGRPGDGAAAHPGRERDRDDLRGARARAIRSSWRSAGC